MTANLAPNVGIVLPKNVNCVKLGKPLNAPLPIMVTLDGMVSDPVRPEQLINA